jgi:hypothetical protein
MAPRCAELAPLEIVMTDDPLYVACEEEASDAAWAAWREVYDRALAECVADVRADGRGACCFSRAPRDRADIVGARDECDRRCIALAARPHSTIVHGKFCGTKIVSPKNNPAKRAATEAAEAAAQRCATGERLASRKTPCDELGSHIERLYCKGKCNGLVRDLRAAVLECLIRASEGQGVVCDGLPPELTTMCESECRDRAAVPSAPASPGGR